MPKRNHSRLTHEQRLYAPLVGDFVNTLIGRSWLTVGRTLDETEEMVKNSFSHDFTAMTSFLRQVTDGRIQTRTLAYIGRSSGRAHLVSYPDLGGLQDDLPTLIQFPALFGGHWDDDETKAWSRLFAPRLRPFADGRRSDEFDMRASFIELRELRAAGVPLEYAKALDEGFRRYHVTDVIDLYRSGVTPEYAWAL